MQEAILAGPDGKPAIDATTGQPLSMEELLRRRGLLVVNGRNALVQPEQIQVTSTPTPQTAQDAAPVVNALAQRKSAQATPSGAEIGKAVTNINTITKGGKSPVAPSMQQLEAEGATPDEISRMEAGGLLAAGTAAAFAIYMAKKMRASGQSFGADDINAPRSRVPVRLDEVPTSGVIDGGTIRAQQEIPEPAKVLAENKRKLLAKPQGKLENNYQSGVDATVANKVPMRPKPKKRVNKGRVASKVIR